MLQITSKKMIKPSTPTPQKLHNHRISFTDELEPPMNISLILFYSSLSSPSSSDVSTYVDRLQQSLANVLPRFYPLAGRYVRKDHAVICNDEGVEFVEARASSSDDLLPFKNSNQKLVDALLPRLPLEADEVTDPLAAVKVTAFDSGPCSLAIGLSLSHRILDADSVHTFLRAWAQEARNDAVVVPSFDTPALFPFKNFFPGSENKPLQRTADPNIISKRFVFDEDAIKTLKSKVTDTSSRRVSKVGVVSAVITKAVIHVDQSKNGKFRKKFIVGQLVNIRDRTVPPLPKYSCGNLAVLSTLKLSPTESNVGFQDLVFSLRESIDKTIDGCARVGGGGSEGHHVLYDSIMELMMKMVPSGEEPAKIFSFSDWSKFNLYEAADFGWGKPIWTSMATMPVSDIAVLMGNEEGDGIEAWVHLYEEDMALFEEELIKLLGDLSAI